MWSRLLWIPEFRRFVWEDYLRILVWELVDAQTNDVRALKAMRELLVLDFLMKVSDWWAISPEEMISMQWELKKFWEAYWIYQQYSNATWRTNVNVEEATIRIDELEKNASINDAKIKPWASDNIIQWPWTQNAEV